jgi:hypothetical protein
MTRSSHPESSVMPLMALRDKEDSVCEEPSQPAMISKDSSHPNTPLVIVRNP